MNRKGIAMKTFAPLVLIAALLLTLPTGCDSNNQNTSASQSSGERQTIRTVPMFYNGQEFEGYDIDPPLKDVPLSEIMERAEANDPAAISELGRRYIRGEGVPRDQDKGFQLAEQAARMGDPDALNDMGVVYQKVYFTMKKTPKRRSNISAEPPSRVKPWPR